MYKDSSSPDGSGGGGSIVPGSSGNTDSAVLSSTLPDTNSLSLHVLLAAEGTDVLAVLGDFHLLHGLTERSTIPAK